MDFSSRKVIGIIGGRTEASNHKTLKLAEETGYLIAKNNAILICGGMSGIMEASCKGAKRANGLTIGILPDNIPDFANKYIDIKIPTGMGVARNIIIVNSANALIAIDGKYGTLSEIAFALQFNKPIISLSSWGNEISDKITIVDTPLKAVSKALNLTGENNEI